MSNGYGHEAIYNFVEEAGTGHISADSTETAVK